MQERIARDLETTPENIDINTQFSEFGLDSFAILIATGELAEWLGQTLEAETLFRYSTIKELSQHLAA